MTLLQTSHAHTQSNRVTPHPLPSKGKCCPVVEKKKKSGLPFPPTFPLPLVQMSFCFHFVSLLLHPTLFLLSSTAFCTLHLHYFAHFLFSSLPRSDQVDLRSAIHCVCSRSCSIRSLFSLLLFSPPVTLLWSPRSVFCRSPPQPQRLALDSLLHFSLGLLGFYRYRWPQLQLTLFSK